MDKLYGIKYSINAKEFHYLNKLFYKSHEDAEATLIDVLNEIQDKNADKAERNGYFIADGWYKFISENQAVSYTLYARYLNPSIIRLDLKDDNDAALKLIYHDITKGKMESVELIWFVIYEINYDPSNDNDNDNKPDDIIIGEVYNNKYSKIFREEL